MRITRIERALVTELQRHARAIEIDLTLTKINLSVILGRRTGEPVKVLYEAKGETDLTEATGDGRPATEAGPRSSVNGR
jgi:hypothetical protein